MRGRRHPLLSREFVLVVEMMGLVPTTPCLQSQIGRGRQLAGLRTAQVMAAVGLSVGVRWGPLASVCVNGTVVARPARTTVAGPRGVGIRSTPGEARPGDA
jgi:hypothetical protein